MKTKINLSKKQGEVFYKYIYPLFAKDFLINLDSYEDFAEIVSAYFILNSNQWDEVLKEWETKESILTN